MNTSAEMNTIYCISRGMPNLRCFWQNLSIARIKDLKDFPPLGNGIKAYYNTSIAECAILFKIVHSLFAKKTKKRLTLKLL